jgi:hypothetical protein
MKPLRIFISHAPQDLPFASEIQAQLASAGQLPWMQAGGGKNLPVGQDHDSAVFRMIDQSDALLVVLSPYALASTAVRFEWQMARRRNKPVLLLLVQSVRPVDFLAALQPCLPGPCPPPDGEIIPWIDVRGKPLEAAWRALAWLKDRSGSQYHLPPAPSERFRFYTETLPVPARLAGWGQLILAGLSMLSALVCLGYLVRIQILPDPPLFLDQFLLTLLTGAAILWLFQLFRLGWNGVDTFRRRCLPVGEVLIPIDRLFAAVALLLVFLGVASSLLGKTALLHGTLYPARSIVFGFFSAILAAAYYLPVELVKVSRQLRAWMPDPVYNAVRTAESDVTPASLDQPTSPAGAVAATSSGNGQTHDHNHLPETRPLPSRSSTLASRLYFTRRLRLAVSSGPAEPALAGAPSGFGLIHSLRNEPAFQVSVLFAPQDAPFGRSLERYLHENGLHIQNDLQECVQAHVNARINTSSSINKEDGALILVLSPWLKETSPLREYWQSAQAAGMPILPVLLEDTPIPLEFCQTHWVDARRDLSRARRQILETVRKKRELPPVPLLPSSSHRSDEFSPNGQRPQAPTVIPHSVQVAQWGLLISSALKLIILAVLFPMALWMAPSLSPGQWMSSGLLLTTTYIQLLAVTLFFMRRLSYPWLMLVQGDCLLAGLTSMPFLRSDLFWPVSTLAQVASLFPLWEAAVFAWLIFVPEIRHWALGGFWLRLHHLRFSWTTILNILVPILIALVFLLPVLSTGPGAEFRPNAGHLTPGEPILVRILPGQPQQIWSFTASGGDLVTIQADGGFNTFLLQFLLYRQKRFLVQSQSTLGSANISSFLLPEDGVYEIHLVEPRRLGLFRLSLTLQRPTVQALECGYGQRELLASAQVNGWVFQAHKGETLQLRMDAQSWTLDPWISLYGPSGSLMAADDDGGRLFNSRIPAFYVSESGVYNLLTGGQPGTFGEYQLALLCSH